MVRKAEEEVNDRTCIVSRETTTPDELIRFVAAPDGAVVPDLKRQLPGRGCWVTGTRAHLEKALKRKLFPRALKADVVAPPDLADQVERLLERNALGALGLARKAGSVVLGAAQVEAAVRSGKAWIVFHAHEASPDGVRKITNARRAVVHMEGPEIASYKLFDEAQMGLALGGTNVIHAAVLGESAGKAVEKRVLALHRFRGGDPDDGRPIDERIAADRNAAEDQE
ncbi:MAG: RNA-binding protein [Mesorhizobium amorphae]|nr:MAG: RNA-binding protein [Mesorhizobium amorphae]